MVWGFKAPKMRRAPRASSIVGSSVSVLTSLSASLLRPSSVSSLLRASPSWLLRPSSASLLRPKPVDADMVSKSSATDSITVLPFGEKAPSEGTWVGEGGKLSRSAVVELNPGSDALVTRDEP